MHVRETDPLLDDEIQLVANRMRETLVDVLGQARAEALYTMEWLRARVEWHLSLGPDAQVLLAENDLGEIIGQAIVRVETDGSGHSYGYFSTIYVAPEYRRQGVAKALIEDVIHWCQVKRLPFAIYNTAYDNQRLIELYQKFGFQEDLRDGDMVQLKKVLG